MVAELRASKRKKKKKKKTPNDASLEKKRVFLFIL